MIAPITFKRRHQYPPAGDVIPQPSEDIGDAPILTDDANSELG